MKINIISWIVRILVAVILGQTLLFKFTDAPETVALFAKLDAGAAMYKTIVKGRRAKGVAYPVWFDFSFFIIV